MNLSRLVQRSLAHHARSHAATVAGAALASAVLTGALLLGASVHASLQRAADLRLGRVTAVLGGGERHFRSALADELQAAVPEVELAPVLATSGSASDAAGAARVLDVRVLGVDRRFFALGPRGDGGPPLAPGSAAPNESLARALGLGGGDEILLRVERPSAVPRDMLLATEEDQIQPLRLTVGALAGPERFGRFALAAGAEPAVNLFVPLEWLQERLGVPGRANLLLACAPAAPEGGDALAGLAGALRERWTLADAELEWRPGPEHGELLSARIFLDESLLETLASFDRPLLGILTYFVNGLSSGGRTTPYSTASACGPVATRAAPGAQHPALLREGVPPGEVWINRWLANDLATGPGGELELAYFALGPARRLEERRERLRIGRVVPLEPPWADPLLMPEFPGLSDARNCRDWEPGIPVDLERIRPEDERYWDEWRGTPKAFLALETGQALWANRFGSLTAVRCAAPDGERLLAHLRARQDPARLGLSFRPVSGAVAATSDFGALFLGLSLFLIFSACLLSALFFAFALERRASEIGVLRVCGFERRTLLGMCLFELGLQLLVGCLLGCLLGLGYTALLLRGLEHLWRDAVGRIELVLVLAPAPLLTGAALALLAVLASTALVLRAELRAPPLRLLLGRPALEASPARPDRRGSGLAVALPLLCALGVLVFLRGRAGPGAAGLAFAAGALLLAAGLAAARLLVRREHRPGSLLGLGWTNASRRPGRALATLALMASAVFLLVVALANRQGPTPVDLPRDSGTGGFALLGRSSVPVLQDLDDPRGREFYGLGADELAGVTIVPMRVRAGDEASCFNLDRPRTPRLAGVDPARLSGRFRFAERLHEASDPWRLLESRLGPGVVPAVVDATSLRWTLHGQLGSEFSLEDERGQPFRARVVATLEDSVLQGELLLHLRDLERLYPSESGQRAFLIDAPRERAAALAARLTSALSDVGLALMPAHERLDLLHGVQNTYLSIFQVLGALALLLGSVGLAALVLRHGLERRGELALACALGFTRADLRRALLAENGGLALLGLGLGALAGLVVLLCAPMGSLDGARTLLAWLAAVAASAWLWIELASRAALRGGASAILREE